MLRPILNPIQSNPFQSTPIQCNPIQSNPIQCSAPPRPTPAAAAYDAALKPSAPSMRDREPPAPALVRRWRQMDREWPCWMYAFAVPSEEALALLASHAPIVEMGCGTGYWAALLRQRGVKASSTTHLSPRARISPCQRLHQPLSAPASSLASARISPCHTPVRVQPPSFLLLLLPRSPPDLPPQTATSAAPEQLPEAITTAASTAAPSPALSPRPRPCLHVPSGDRVRLHSAGRCERQ